jgi:CPA1 family monovalent cation:H+ antiporter
MGFFEISSILLTLAALLSFLNYKLLRLPTTIGVMTLALAASLVLIGLGSLAGGVRMEAARLVGAIDFNRTVLHGMLALLLFAGSLHLDLSDLAKEWDAIALLAALGTAASTFLIGGLTWLAFDRLGAPTPFIYCLLFGALISPTDPISVLGIMKRVGASRAMETQVAGESLFNDGIGVVFFLALLEVATSGASPSWSKVGLLLVKEVAGGAVVGLACGVLTYHMLKRVDNYQVEVLLTLALATGGFTLAEALHVSAPIAVVVAGLFIGNQGRAFAMSARTEEHVDTFWELIDDILNAVLFLLIGLKVLVLSFTFTFLWAGLAAIVAALLARVLIVAGSVRLMRAWRSFEPGTIQVLTWGGLRGGLSVAMALAIPAGKHRDLLLAVTYVVVVFSVFVQGLSVGWVIRRVTRQ